MARPTKEGLEYFPLVTNFEDKIILLIAEFGASGVGIVVSLYQKIYNNSYYIEWNDDSLMLFARYVNEEINRVNEVINKCFDRNIFDKSLYEKYGILTSHGIQKQYLKVCKEARRKRVGFVKEYCLVKDKELLSIITELTCINTEETPVNDSDNTQSKVKESKEKKSTNTPGKNNSSPKAVIDYYHTKFVEKFHEKPVIAGKKDGDLTKRLVNAYGLEKTKDLLDKFFDAEDEFIKQSGYTISVFFTQVNKLLTMKARHPPQHGRL